MRLTAEDAFELTEDEIDLTNDETLSPEVIPSTPELVIYDDPAPETDFGFDLAGQGAVALEDLLRDSSLPLALEDVDWIAPAGGIRGLHRL